MPYLNSCCGCISLRTGTIVTGVLGIVSAIITLILILATKVKFRTIALDNLSPTIVKIILGLNLAMTVLISILLIIGAVKRKIWFMLPWVVLTIIVTIGLAISVIYTVVELYINNDAISGTVGLFMGIMLVALHIYLWFVVFSYFQLVREEKNRGPYGRPYKD